jgi:heme/copper-type cytochrome/quinol oxidase subunit 4
MSSGSTPEVEAKYSGEPGGFTTYLVVYLCILVLAGINFLIAYEHADTTQVFMRMFLIAVAEGGLAVLFFMHLWREQRNFLAVVTISLAFVIGMMNMVWFDSFRLLNFRLLK